eukprot:TRINITY_DN66136_c0_g1_i1.p1 TRINITY_DN66136_c0_g1~~TRINITY_DN66136_c0_g1_i1.p1  ORF type:complete len:321 (+),score=97.47 TRINITY_DN66136_c0_g1_i1:82-963(+)
MRPSRVLCNGAGDFFEKWVSRAKAGTGFGGGMVRGEHATYTPQMQVRHSPYPKFPAKFGIPKPHEAKVGPRPHRDMPALAPMRWDDLTPQAAKERESRLPGVLFQSELPQDPVDRLFFQVKPENAELLASNGKPDNPEEVWELTNVPGMKARDNNKWKREPLSQMCTALHEQKTRRERFITVFVSEETKAVARLLLDLGFIAGLRDYNNGHKFSIETKWWDNIPAVMNMAQLSLYQRDSRIHWTAEEVQKVLYFNKVYNVIRIYFIRLESGEIVHHMEACRRNAGGEPLCYVD